MPRDQYHATTLERFSFNLFYSRIFCNTILAVTKSQMQYFIHVLDFLLHQFSMQFKPGSH